MAKLSKILFAAVETVFKTFEEAVNEADYEEASDDGLGTASEETIPVRLIADSFTQEDLKVLPFSDDIQPTDVKGLVPGIDLDGVTVKSGHQVTVTDVKTGDQSTYSVIEFDVDAYKALYTLLLRSG